MQKKYWIIGLFSLLAFTSCKDKKNKKNDDAKEVPVLTIQKKDTMVSTEYVAEIQAKKNIEIHSRIAGLLQDVAVHEGQYVHQGQLLFKINDAELQIDLLKVNANVKQAEADVSIAKVELNQAQSLYSKKFVAKNELDMAKAKMSAAQAKYAYADAERKAVLQKINFTNIRAPFSGVMNSLPLKEGSLVEDGTLLTTLSQLSEIYAYFSIPENLYFEMMKNGELDNTTKIELVLPNGSKYDFNGVLNNAEGEIDPSTGSIRYKVMFPNPDRYIKHGTSGKLIISKYQPDAILIPQKATYSIQDKTYVFVVDKNNKVKMTNVTIATTLHQSYLISSGLKAGDRVVVEGTQSLKDGQTIKIKK
ncbi:efflux RND transporter periplasmic adaptor subunit [Elizabethkingia sp. JS20170427COW]|uniref:efflux RND transporter periplasmic adaptor subunit n=1 Tax=Elizabethkingia sp. JS20170427COW TaxID=2583851 RepID=UPI0011106F1F|nr:efflux RND transporter periplasmic adaptor subunit [Elizabethkingia sp. JS20170427COW]QCX53765.1 efflux RND transporter periplasmic adaptor subunit [Elizabethkingia sp. JS20170427COW]